MSARLTSPATSWVFTFPMYLGGIHVFIPNSWWSNPSWIYCWSPTIWLVAWTFSDVKKFKPEIICGFVYAQVISGEFSSTSEQYIHQITRVIRPAGFGGWPILQDVNSTGSQHSDVLPDASLSKVEKVAPDLGPEAMQSDTFVESKVAGLQTWSHSNVGSRPMSFWL